jgi:hypothetical protein
VKREMLRQLFGDESPHRPEHHDVDILQARTHRASPPPVDGAVGVTRRPLILQRPGPMMAGNRTARKHVQGARRPNKKNCGGMETQN